MEWIDVESSNIRAIGYDENLSRLGIKFKDGTVYEYDDVPQYIFEDFRNADSKGKYGHRNIYKTYNGRKI